MRRSLILFASFAVALMLPAAVALAADPAEVADAVDPRGYYIEVGAPVDFSVMEALVDEVAGRSQTVFYFVALATDPSQGTDEFAEDVLLLLPQGSTVVVLSPTETGARSDTFTDAELDRAAEAMAADSDSSYEGDFRAFALSLTGASVPTTGAGGTTPSTTTPGSSGGGSGAWVFLLILAAVIAVVFFLTRRGAKQDRDLSAKRIEEAKGEIRRQIDAIANEILELTDKVTLAENDQAEEYFRAASATFQDAQDRLDGATNLAELEQLSDQLDTTRWQLEAADAVLEGRPVPPEPEDRPNACFFDPTHRAGVEEAQIQTPAGSRTVSVCRDCAEKLRRGEQPQPREISVGGRRVPAAMAPRSYGGGGFDWMGAFAIILSGLARGASYNYGRRPRRTVRLGGPLFPSGGIGRTSSGRGGSIGRSVARSVGRSVARGMGRTRRKR